MSNAVLAKLTLTPQQAGYKVKPDSGVISQKLDGGRSKYRDDIDRPSKRISCKWYLKPLEFEYMEAFYETVAKRGANAFKIDLLLNDGTVLKEVTANFIPDTYNFTVTGIVATISATLEVESPVEDADANNNLVFLYNNYGSDSQDFINEFEELMTVTLPGLSAF